MNPVKTQNRSKNGPIAERLAILLGAFSPWERISLTYRQLAAELGPPVTEAAIKKWSQRKKFPADVARLIVAKARQHGLTGVTLEWVLWGEGEGDGPQKAPQATLKRSHEQESVSLPTAPHEPHGGFAAWIGEALQADLSHNEFGQWSSVEVQHTVIWALKDLARRLWVLHFDMGKTFELTDQWAGKVGLPVRTPGPSADEGGPGGGT
jgi:hypothetical protein